MNRGEGAEGVGEEAPKAGTFGTGQVGMARQILESRFFANERLDEKIQA